MQTIFKKPLFIGISLLVLVLLFFMINPFAYNSAGYRTVVTRATGDQFVQFNAGTYYAGFFSKEAEWPNQISVIYQDTIPNIEFRDGAIEIGQITARFNDATTAKISGVTQYILPSGETEMINLHNAHKTPESLVQRRLGPYTKECLQSSGQLMSSEMHYGGGRAQMAQDYLDQLQNGAFLLHIEEIKFYDTLEKSYKKVYQVEIQKDRTGLAKRKFSSIKEYGITVADAQIKDVDYEYIVDNMIAKKIAASTLASVSKQELMTAQQQAMTSKAKGEKALVDIEYQQKQEQTKQVVAAETEVKLAEQDKFKQKIAAEAADLEARKIRTLADANAYEKQRAIQANGALEQKLDAYIKVQEAWAKAFSSYGGNVVPTIQTGGSTNNGAMNFMELIGMKAARDLSLDLKNK